MLISSDDLHAMGFWRAGTVFPDPVSTVRVQIDRDVHGSVVHVMVVNQEVVKAGKTHTPLSTRIKSTINSLKNKMGVAPIILGYQENLQRARTRNDSNGTSD